MNAYSRPYAAYCASSGLEPDECLRRDEEEFPGGCMTGFILWIGARRREYASRHPDKLVMGGLSDLEHWQKFLQPQAELFT